MFFMDIVPQAGTTDQYLVSVREGNKPLYSRMCKSEKALRRYVKWHRRRHGAPFVGLMCGVRGVLEKLGLDSAVAKESF